MNIRVTVGKSTVARYVFSACLTVFATPGRVRRGRGIFRRWRPAEHKNRENTLAYKERM